MPSDKSLFFYGSIYHRILDPQLAEAHQVAANLITEGSAVLDIACGTGQFSLAVRRQKQCRVVGLDLSLRMLEFARKSNPFHNVTFVHEDATDLGVFDDHSFDYAAILFLMHELPMQQRVLVLKEALRISKRVIIIDSVAPLPKNAGGIGIRIVEATFGRDHNPNFKAFLATGGIRAVLQESGLPISIESSSIFWRDCREVLLVSSSVGRLHV